MTVGHPVECVVHPGAHIATGGCGDPAAMEVLPDHVVVHHVVQVVGIPIESDDSAQAAVFQDLGSSPAAVEASRAADAYGLSPGVCVQVADADQAYTQSYLKGPKTWVSLPNEQWPDSWKKRDPKTGRPRFRQPVVPLIRALYGHPDSGGYWERHCNAHLAKCGFVPIENWPSMFWNQGSGFWD